MGFIFTIGHSNHDIAGFIGLLQRHGIAVLIDVRTFPVSQYSTQFNRPALAPVLAEQAIRYSYLGDELGGRPHGSAFYDDQGYVLYDLVARTPAFERGIGRLIRNASRYRLAVMCSEEDPSGCHRRLLVGRVLVERGIAVRHIRRDGTVQDDAELDRLSGAPGEPATQPALFDVPQERVWRSARSVLPRSPRRNSSEH